MSDLLLSDEGRRFTSIVTSLVGIKLNEPPPSGSLIKFPTPTTASFASLSEIAGVYLTQRLEVESGLATNASSPGRVNCWSPLGNVTVQPEVLGMWANRLMA